VQLKQIRACAFPIEERRTRERKRGGRKREKGRKGASDERSERGREEERN
jgi:hypothetical protein